MSPYQIALGKQPSDSYKAAKPDGQRVLETIFSEIRNGYVSKLVQEDTGKDLLKIRSVPDVIESFAEQFDLYQSELDDQESFAATRRPEESDDQDGYTAKLKDTIALLKECLSELDLHSEHETARVITLTCFKQTEKQEYKIKMQMIATNSGIPAYEYGYIIFWLRIDG